MNKSFHLELVSPESKLLSENVWQVNIPGEIGDVGIRPGHMALVMTVRAGVVEIIRKPNDKPTRFFVAGGFADISQTHCTILAELAIPVANINAEELSIEMSELNVQLDQAIGVERVGIQDKINLVSAMIKAAD